MKNLLTIILILLCFVSKAQDNGDVPLWQIPDIQELHMLLYANDYTVDTFLVTRNWEFSTRFKADSNRICTEYGYNVNNHSRGTMYIVMSADSTGKTYGVNLMSASRELQSYIVAQAIDSGFIFVDQKMDTMGQTKYYERHGDDCGFIAVSMPDVSDTDETGNLIKIHKYISILVRQDGYKMYRDKHGMKNKPMPKLKTQANKK